MGANLHGAKLEYADLYGADLQNADLSEAMLLMVILRRTDLRKANFQGADLRGADFEGADLREADLRGSEGFDPKNKHLGRAHGMILGKQPTGIENENLSTPDLRVKVRDDGDWRDDWQDDELEITRERQGLKYVGLAWAEFFARRDDGPWKMNKYGTWRRDDGSSFSH